MKSTEGVFVTDGVNRQNMLMPLSSIVSSMETHIKAALAANRPIGVPVNLAHDNCRPLGWGIARGVYIAKDMSRQLGTFYIPETDDEKSAIERLIGRFRGTSNVLQNEPFIEGLTQRLTGQSLDDIRYWHGEATAAVAKGLAAALVPEFFSGESSIVDKDGLVDYAELLARTKQIHPGVFHEPKRDVLLFVHRFFRRSLSLHNSLNQYFLHSFHNAATDGVIARLKLDPDLVGHPGSAQAVMEQEYWHGPRFNEDVSKIPSGVAHHKNDKSSRVYSQVDTTQIWWKEPETRTDTNRVYRVRTFEIEELIDAPSAGLQNGAFGCRYAHAEYDVERCTISHFDGAIRAYDGDSYIERVDRRIDRAGKHADYTKLFRLDGSLAVATWKRVLSDFYRGNALVPEYLGAPPLNEVIARQSKPETVNNERLPDLSAYIGLRAIQKPSPASLSLRSEQMLDWEGDPLEVVEVGRGKLEALLRPLANDVATLSADHLIVNVATIDLPSDAAASWESFAPNLAGAIIDEVDADRLDQISITVSWICSDIATTLSIAGAARRVAAVLGEAAMLVRPDIPASEWAEPFRDALLRHSPNLDASVDWSRVAPNSSRIELPRSGEVSCCVWLPETPENDTRLNGVKDAVQEIL